MNNTVNVGDRAKDTITGFSGIVICKTLWLNGCNRICIRPEQLDKEGRPSDVESFDIEQIEIIVNTAILATPIRKIENDPELGDCVAHKIHGFSGVVIAINEWFDGDRGFIVQPQELKDGKTQKTCTFGTGELVITNKKAHPAKPPTGGWMPDPDSNH